MLPAALSCGTSVLHDALPEPPGFRRRISLRTLRAAAGARRTFVPEFHTPSRPGIVPVRRLTLHINLKAERNAPYEENSHS